MKTSWPDPPPLFGLAELEQPGERPSWVPRVTRRRSPAAGPRPRPAFADATPLPLDLEDARMTFSDIAAGFAPDPGRLLTRVGVFDLETTGVDVGQDRIVTACVAVLDVAGEVLFSRAWVADPGIEIPAGAAAVHGFTTARARAEGRPAREVVAEIAHALGTLLSAGIPVVAYNAAFDFSVLRHELARHELAPLDGPSPVIDPLVIDKQHDRFRRGKRTLDAVAAHYGVPLTDAHEASADAIAAGRVALAQAERFRSELPADVAALHAAQVGWSADQAASLEEYFLRIGRLQPGETIDGAWPVR
ncbi:exonuclease domain-containing protein [Microbacterium excoecariae]|uniref:exonuclease domain-containing protein n=1 Tax=Microbacterium excoecariae TaxID=2715210 RepID=UPI001407E464|nr:exonuclease domain-containing protein [Microbacterium excoecariae]